MSGYCHMELYKDVPTILEQAIDDIKRKRVKGHADW